ncbi:MAG: protein phosphatase CheZ [Oceanibaculum nanhaiense]|jgi:chemotaxis protein CheZ|uniref:protein phosphatase CheZ n=1 Tax=Oceanibaculum nanhaiense TaxID=1909734 RepID=UPI0032ED6688
MAVPSKFSAKQSAGEDAADLAAGPAVTTDEVVAIVEQMLSNLRGDLSPGAMQLYGELEDLARFIRDARHDLAEIRPEDIRDHHIPSATDELDAVIGATEEATGRILDACEVFSEVSGKLSAEDAERTMTAVTEIYEACNFQDITGQRITKVVGTLKHIEDKIEQLLEAFGAGVGTAKAAAAKQPPAAAKPKSTDDKPDADLLNGPQLPGNANSQEDIDAILASFD